MQSKSQWNTDELIIWAHFYKMPYYVLDRINDTQLNGGIFFSLVDDKYLQETLKISNENDRRNIINTINMFKQKSVDSDLTKKLCSHVTSTLPETHHRPKRGQIRRHAAEPVQQAQERALKTRCAHWNFMQ